MGLRKTIFNTPAKIAISFILLILFGTFLLCTPLASTSGQWWGFTDALFTSTSAVCVTGLVVVDTAVHFTIFGQIVLMLLIQIGGLGFISISAMIILMAGKRLSYKNRIALQESLNEDSTQGIVILIKKIALIVFSIEGVGFMLLLPSMIIQYGGAGVFKAMFLSVSAFCNAGFDVMGTTGLQFQSLAPFAQNVLVLLPIMFLIVFGGIGYSVILEIVGKFNKETKKAFSFHAKVVLQMTIFLIVIGTVLFAIFEWNNPLTIGDMPVFQKIMNALFQAITPRTAGFATFDQANLTSSSRVVMDFLMFIGGSPTSIAGGVKTTTIYVLLVAAFRPSSASGDIIIRRKQIPNHIVRKCLRIVFSAIILFVVSTLLILVIEHHNSVATSSAVVFEVLSALSTVGSTLGLTPTLSVMSKLILTTLMFIGRVGALTLSFAIHHKSPDAYGEIKYPETNLIVG